jgi:CheY-like chemotaxis protein
MTCMSPSSCQANGDLTKILYSIEDEPAAGSLPATVLVVDDNAMARIYAVIVVEDAGYSALVANDADAALDALSTYPAISALFTDVDMPGRMDGLELAAEARRLRPDLGILIASGKREPYQEALPERAVFVSKPYEVPIVAVALAALLAEAAQFKGGSAR